jgi:DNA-binding transcriptional MocR family regulator
MADSDGWATTDLVLYPDSPMPLYLQLAREMRAHVSRLELPAGALLPSVSALSERLGLSHNTVTKAYELLRDVGTIKARRGTGWFVTQAIPPVYVAIEPGSEVRARPIRPTDKDAIKDARVALMASALVVETPGKRPVAYDAMRTVIRLGLLSQAASCLTLAGAAPPYQASD